MIFRIVWPLLSGRAADDAAATYWEDLEGRFAGATLISSPAHLTRLPPRTDLFAPPPAQIFSSGQLLPYEAAQACIAAFGKPATEVLGSTETGGIAWRQQVSADEPWTPFSLVRVTQADDGALAVRSPYLQTDAPQHTGDGLAFLNDGRFRLKPRGDRVVKIDGKRVSLTRVEASLAKLAEIETASALTLPERRDALAAVVVLTPAGKALLDKRGPFRLSRQLRQAAAGSLEPAERPKHWRFVEAMPINSEGKRVLSTLRGLFMATDPLETLDLDIRTKSDAEAEIAFSLSPDLIFFRGHFPGRAIMPGVAQAHLAVLLAQRLWDTWPADANLARLKFKRVLLPNDQVILKLKRNAEIGRVTFSYQLGEIEVSNGEIGGFSS
jgi:acyl-coenzyme A synthetase/AMP-(fatty) acid ligase/3-hydroxymyristoyl/3-hydroxydecanoyl-(acyl carrier protein) dehydratase